MAELEDMASRLSMLEDEYNNDKRVAKENNFFDKYGSKFKNDRGIGLSILNELDRQGIDVSAADEAVEAILDELRTECRELMDIIGDVRQAVEEQTEKIEAVKDVVDKEIADNPDSSVNPDEGAEAPLPEGGEMPVPEEGAAPEMPAPPEGGAMPPEGEAAPVPPESGEAPVPPEGSEAPAPTEEENPETVPSDERIKNISRVVSDIRMKRIQSKGIKPSAAILSAASRGF